MPLPNLSAFPNSPYAAELQRGVAAKRFSQYLETEYVRSRLSENRALVRVTCVLAALLSLFGLVRQSLEGHLGSGHLLQILAVFLASFALASVACSPGFWRFYLPLAQIVVPIRNALATTLIVRIAASGQMEILMVLPLMVVGPFFLLGLPPRAALLAVAAAIASFIVSAAVFALPNSPAFFACALLLMVTISCAIATRHIDEGSRKSFLQSCLVAEFAEQDALTGTRNRRVFDEHLDLLWQRSIEDRGTIAVLLIDVDYFKRYNDRYGHQAGDLALRRVAETLQLFVDRPLDVLARYGGEEFAVVLHDTDRGHAGHVADRMRRAVEALAIEHCDGVSGKVTISIGVAVLAPTAERSPRGALQLADQALYEAKVRGRNRVELKKDDDFTLLITGVFSKSAFPAARHDGAAGPACSKAAQG